MVTASNVVRDELNQITKTIRTLHIVTSSNLVRDELNQLGRHLKNIMELLPEGTTPYSDMVHPSIFENCSRALSMQLIIIHRRSTDENWITIVYPNNPRKRRLRHRIQPLHVYSQVSKALP